MYFFIYISFFYKFVLLLNFRIMIINFINFIEFLLGNLIIKRGYLFRVIFKFLILGMFCRD